MVAMDSILEGNKVNKHFGGLMAIKNLDFSLKGGEIHGLIGPNGAGKTTLINCISGFYHADSGAIQFAGIDISGHSSPEICEKGIARTFQIPKYFANETVLRHVMAAAVFGRSSLSGRTLNLEPLRY